ncbi:hypothetical protein LAZ67_X002626 [Cordylochernes scorpioides]|uniref:Reverse transcriptase domain-containing protein n=1 Tax=Cordylochernes scorpioides TaxID=51811 RepID=A0ABY6LTI7_9ARAC|nr:hypothetical protein LAZ67_X002626 [Cordylochernes scorpioides]
MDDCIPASVPMDPSVILTKQDCPTPEQKEKLHKFPFREAIGSLMFASCVSRPDITYAVSHLSLKSNIFNFNSQSFKQIKGSPMGSPLSSPLAEIVMNTIDKWITTQFPTDIIIYKRYIDDIFCICTANKVNHILKSLNNYHPRIKFTIEVEKNNINYHS